MSNLSTIYGDTPSAELAHCCPKCKTLMRCPCDNCRKHDRPGVFWVDMEDGEVIKCGTCGFTAHHDFWFDWEWDCMHADKQVAEETP